jgi:hypothetical protein
MLRSSQRPGRHDNVETHFNGRLLHVLRVYDPLYFAKDSMMYYWRAIIERVFVDTNTLIALDRAAMMDGWMLTRLCLFKLQ